jgi:hypothetical protein
MQTFSISNFIVGLRGSGALKKLASLSAQQIQTSISEKQAPSPADPTQSSPPPYMNIAHFKLA